MNRKKIGIAITVVPVLAAGTVAMASAYKSGTDFTPRENSQELQANQVVFDNGESGVDRQKKEKKEESSLLQDQQEEKEKENTQLKDQADYLFENDRLHSRTAGVSEEGNTDSPTQQTPEEEKQPAETYNIVKDPSKADTELNGTKQNGGNGTDSSQSGGNNPGSSNSGNSGNNNGKPAHSVTPTPTPSDKPSNIVTPSPVPDIPTPTPVPSRPASSAKDPESQKSNPTIGGGGGQISFKPYKEGITPSTDDEEDGSNRSIVIQQSSYNSGSDLYEGQTVSIRDIYNALDTLVYANDGNGYLWGEEALDKYVKILAVSFDGGKKWITDFPVTIPENIGEGKMIIRAAYRLSTGDSKWTERLVPYTPKENRIFVLSAQITEEEQVISEDEILNDDQHPELGQKINLFNYQSGMFQGNDLTALFPGWMEDGKLVSWLYPVTRGRHILEPADMVPLDSRYKAKLVLEWMSDDYEVDNQYSNLVYLQTLTGFTEKAQQTVYNGNDKRQYRKVTVPQYIQSVVIDTGSGLATDYLEIPDSVIYIENTQDGLEVDQGYLVGDGNRNYSSTEEGVLTNKTQTSYLAIPCKMEELTVPEKVTNISLTADNNIRELRLEARTMDLMPEISYQSLHDCKTIIDDALLEDFIEKNYKALASGKNNSVAAEEDPEITYTVKNEGIVSSEGRLRRVLSTGRKSYILSNAVDSVQAEAFEDRDGITALVMPRNGKTVELEADCLTGSRITKIRCYSEEQYESVQQQLDQSGAAGEIELELLGTSREGYHYCITQKEDQEKTVLVEAPEDISYFDGTVTAADGTSLMINTIDDNAFENCRKLVWAIIPESVEEIGYQAFEDCTSLQGVMIRTTDTITIGNMAWDGCSALRFIASNAMTGILEEDSVPALTDSVGNKTVYVPTNSEGYNMNCVHFTEESGVSSYELTDIGGNGKMLYGLDENGIPWLAIRSGTEVGDQVTLPASTIEVFAGAMEDTCSPGGNFTINWGDLGDMWALDSSAFNGSQLGGSVTLATNALIGTSAFSGCQNITDMEIPGDNINIGDSAFYQCSSLVSVTFGEFSAGSSLSSNLFGGCDALRNITFTGDVPEFAIYGTQPFQFNAEWSREEETQNLRIHVQEGMELSCVKKWRYIFCGYYSLDNETAYQRMWSDVQWEYIDWDTWEFLPDEQIDSILEDKLLSYENHLRTMLGMAQATEPTDFYPYRCTDGMVTLVGVPSYIEELNLAEEDMELPPDTSVNYIASGAFSKCSRLRNLTIPESVIGIYANAFSGVTSEKLVLNFQSATPPQLLRNSEDVPYSFGADDSQMEIRVPEGCEEAYITEWRYALAGYADLDAVRQAVTKDLTEAGETAPTEEEIEKETAKRLLPFENRLRVMMGLDPLEETEDTEALSEELFSDGVQKTEEETENTEETDDSISFEIPAEDESIPDLDESDQTGEAENTPEEETEETDVEISVENEEEIQE